MSDITDRVKAYRDSGEGWEELKDWLASKTYPLPERYTVARDETDDLVPYTEGTWDEVGRCANIGLLTDEEYMDVCRLAYVYSMQTPVSPDVIKLIKARQGKAAQTAGAQKNGRGSAS